MALRSTQCGFSQNLGFSFCYLQCLMSGYPETDSETDSETDLHSVYWGDALRTNTSGSEGSGSEGSRIERKVVITTEISGEF